MDAAAPARVTVELTEDEAKLVVAALRQFEPHWPADMDAMQLTDLLAEVREAITRVSEACSRPDDVRAGDPRAGDG
jgi:hypothetical protein